ncbi:MAG: GH39 family glycosyl hydrolase, partial [Actinomycetota bacterium]
YDFAGIDRVYDRILGLGLRPIVEISFMPRALARDPEATVFTYGGIISPPRDWDRWADLIRALASHLVERYGLEEVARWAFEVWNEPNLEVFWTGTQHEYFRLYETAARAIKSVDGRLRVGGPGSAAAGWIEDFIDWISEHDVPLDFLATHAYGIAPLDLRAAPARRGRPDLPVWWTEWGVTPTHFAGVNDSAFGAPFVLSGMRTAQRTETEAVAYWVVSDQFEELGRPPSLLHGGFGLLTVGNLRKPRYWALALLKQLGPDAVDARVDGDGARSLVDVLAARRGGVVDVLVWNGTLDQSKAEGSPALDRVLRLKIRGLEAPSYSASLARIDAFHSNIGAHWPRRDGWPDERGWRRLRALDRLHEEPLGDLEAASGDVELELELPMPGVARLRLIPGGG